LSNADGAAWRIGASAFLPHGPAVIRPTEGSTALVPPAGLGKQSRSTGCSVPITAFTWARSAHAIGQLRPFRRPEWAAATCP